MSELLALGISHKTAPLELRERVAFTEGRAAGMVRELVEAPEGFRTAFVLRLASAHSASACGVRNEMRTAAPGGRRSEDQKVES